MHAAFKSEKAYATLLTLCVTTVIAISLTSYISLCQNSYNLSTRQFQVGRGRDLAQVGLEEALWALNQNTWNESGPSGSQSWTLNGANATATLSYPSLGQGSSGQVVLTIANYADTGPTWPTITSAATIFVGNGTTVTSTLQATTGPAPLFGNAIASANSYVSFVGGGTVDSWNSNPTNDPSAAPVAYSFTAGNSSNYDAVVAGNDNGAYGVLLNQATVDGYVATFGQPISYSTSGTPSGKVQGPSTASAVNVDPARIGQSAFIPTTSVFTITPPSTSGTGYGGLLGSILALVNALLGAAPSVQVYEINGDLSILGIPLLSPSLTVNRNLQLIIDGNLSISGLGQITVANNASLQIFVSGTVSIGGNGIQNQTQDPTKLAIFCTNGSTTSTVQYTTTSSYTGVIYSENMPIDIQRNATFYGALLSGQYVRFSGSAIAPTVHYDTYLRNVRFGNIATPYIVSQLTQL